MNTQVPYNEDLYHFLELKFHEYSDKIFIESDPIQVPHLFERKQDIEIAGFLTAMISWGQRKSIIGAAHQLMKLMDYRPFEFVTESTQREIDFVQRFYYRTFNGTDTGYFIKALKYIYLEHKGLEQVILQNYKSTGSIQSALIHLRNLFFKPVHPSRTQKHFANILKNSSGKRLNMFLRWMVRKDDKNIDFGLWKEIQSKDLFIPLDVHTGTVARKLGLLSRKSNDWKAVEELTGTLKVFDPSDPVKYDFALFGLGIFEKF